MFFIALINFSLSLFAMYEYAHFDKVLNHLDGDKSTWLVVDVDNTIIEPTDEQMGSHQWFWAYHNDLVENHNCTKEEALQQTMAQFIERQLNNSVKAVEITTADTIKKIQAIGIPVIGLTNRPAPLVQRTREQLLSANIDLTKNLENIIDFEFDVNGKTHIYSQGVIFTQQSHKGNGLTKFIQSVPLKKPERIVYEDDHGENVKAVYETLNQEYPSLEKIAIRYSYLDQKLKNFKLR